MSAVPVRSTRPAVRIRPERAQLRMVRSAPKSRFMTLLVSTGVAIVAAAMALAVGITSLSTEQTYQINDLEAQLSVLNDEFESLRGDALSAASPQELARRAAELGLVRAGAPGTVTLAVGEVTEASPAK
ncbi:hypothetical protein ABYF32_02150 [Buchananella felis]|uniref:hypothetical protein n=1 Tax=Buchananella felis TaxID=3231492 RepID=UPI003528E847